MVCSGKAATDCYGPARSVSIRYGKAVAVGCDEESNGSECNGNLRFGLVWQFW